MQTWTSASRCQFMPKPGASVVKEDTRRQGEIKRTAVLVLGLGNVLLGDDGLGAAAVSRLERDYRIPADVCLQDGGTLGLGLLGLLSEASHVILIDAVRIESPPGSLVRLDGDDVLDAVRDRLSPHQVGVADLLAAARLIDRYPATVTLLGLVPQAIELAIVRSPPVEAALDALVVAVVHEVQSLGYTMVRHSEVPGGLGSMRDPARLFGM
jgi:hydrogenase maturation protease